MARGGEADYTDKWLVNRKFLNPTMTNEELGAPIGMSGKAVSKRLQKPSVKELELKIQTDIFAQAIAIRSKAMANAFEYIQKPESKEGFEMTKMFAQAIADSPATLPDAVLEAPEFYDPNDREPKE